LISTLSAVHAASVSTLTSELLVTLTKLLYLL